MSAVRKPIVTVITEVPGLYEPLKTRLAGIVSKVENIYHVHWNLSRWDIAKKKQLLLDKRVGGMGVDKIHHIVRIVN